MKNIEKYAKEILEYAISTDKAIAVCKATMKPCDCSAASIRCKNCICSVDDSCEDELLYKWAEAEYIEPMKISKKDRSFLDYLKGYRYIARDKSELLYAYTDKPIKLSDRNCWAAYGMRNKNLAGLDIDFPMIEWSDKEPWLIEDLKGLDVCENYEID